MSKVSEALGIEENQAGEGRTVAGIVNSILSGDMERKDSRGHSGRLRSGDVQWMTAGAGVVHSEMPSREFQRDGGRMHGFQLWVNLPQRDKMAKPRYQEIPSAQIPKAGSADGLVTVKVVIR